MAQNHLRDIPMISNPITPLNWRIHLERLEVAFLLKTLPDNAANRLLRKQLLWMSLGKEGAVRCSTATPGGRPAEETYQAYTIVLSRIFKPDQESDLSIGDYKRYYQSPTEPVNAYFSKKRSLFLEAYPLAGDNDILRGIFTDDFITGLRRQEVKKDLLQGKPYAEYQDILTATLRSVATYRALINHGANSKQLDGLYSANQYNATHTAPTTTTLTTQPTIAPVTQERFAPPEPMDLSSMYSAPLEEEQEQYEQLVAALNHEESAEERSYWEDPETQSVVALISQNNAPPKETRVCWSCNKPGHLKAECWRRTTNIRKNHNTNRGRTTGSYGWNRGRSGAALVRGGYGRGKGQPNAAYNNTMEILDRTHYPTGDPRAFGASSKSRQAYSNALNPQYDFGGDNIQAITEVNNSQTENANVLGAMAEGYQFQSNF